MRRNGMRLVAALGVLLGVSSPTVTAAQAVARPAFEALYTRVGYAGGAAGAPAARTVRAEGLGGRVMWPLAAPDDPAPWLARHLAVGLFGAYTPNPDLGFSAGQVGLAADVAPLGRALANRFEPFVSLGAGALHASTTRGLALAPSPRPALSGPSTDARPAPTAVERSSTRFLLVPAMGVRVAVRPRVAVHGDVRTLVTFGGDAPQHHRALGTGVRLTF
jgi:hypothetical protein